jgi:hypothetical protein
MTTMDSAAHERTETADAVTTTPTATGHAPAAVSAESMIASAPS